MAFIVSNIIEARINNLIKKRDDAIRYEDYELAWRLNTRINNSISILIAYC